MISEFTRRFFRTPVFGLVLWTTGLALTTAQAGSLWREAVTDEMGMYADKVARRIGDIVTIVVTESATGTNTLTLKSSKTGTGSTGLAGNLVGMFVSAENNRLKNKSTILGKNGQLPVPSPGGLIVPPGTTAGGNPGTDNSAAVTNSLVLNSQMAVQVIDRLPNGNLVIEGIRQVGFSKERQFASLRGIIRPYDISTSNTVSSTAVADARIEVVSEGALTETQKKGWLMRLDEKISPY